MEHIEQVLKYLQKNGPRRPSQIISGTTVPRRSVYKALALLVKRGQAKKQGFRPKILYSSLIDPVVPKEAQRAPVKEEQKDDQGQISALKQELKELREEFLKVRNELFDTKDALNRKSIDLKSALAKIDYQSDTIQTLKKNSKEYFDQAYSLRQENQRLKREKA